MVELHLDWETRSPEPIGVVGARKYLSHPEADILCAAWCFEGGEVQTWSAWAGHDPGRLIEALERADVVVAHNAQFERLVLEIIGPRYGLHFDGDYRCTAYAAAAANLPRSLGDLSERFKLGDEGKDKAGKALIRKCCCPDRKGNYSDNPDDLEALTAYCAQDVVAEMALDKLIPDNTEGWLYELDRKINDRGIPIDVELCAKAVALADEYGEWANRRMAELTDGVITTVSQVSRIKNWLIEHGVNVSGVAKDVLEYELTRCDDPTVREVMELRLLSGSAAVKKYQAALNYDLGGRIYDQVLICGAAQTGRFAGRGLQPHNMFRGAPSEADIEAVKFLPLSVLRDLYDKDVLGLLQRNVRGIIQAPPGKVFVISDLTGIEARVLPWLAGAAKSLRAFKQFDEGKGEDIYKIAAAGVYKISPKDVSTAQRQLGKILCLSCGYGTGPARVVEQAANYGVQITEEEARKAVYAWRDNNPEIIRLWRELDQGFLAAMNGRAYRVNPRIMFEPGDNHVAMVLPNGRRLYYWEPKKLERNMSFLASNGNRVDKAWGGFFSENCTQAVARDFLTASLRHADIEGLEVVTHVHDEVVLLVDETDAEEAADLLKRIIKTPPAWAPGIPLDCSSDIVTRYSK